MSGTTVYLSATEPTHYYQRAAQAGNQYYLVSYLYLKQRNALRNVEYRKNENPDHVFLIDSGAHTLQGDDLKAFDLDDYKRYMDNYADWLVKNKQYIHACVELDVESAVGMPVVRQWQEDFFIPFEKQGMNVIFVWHPERGVSEFEAMCKRHGWIGIAQDFFDSGQDIGRFMQVARRNMTKVHGFGITNMGMLLSNTFYSVDSTTWKGGEMYGVSYVWDEGRKRIRPIVAKAAQQRYQYRKYFEEIGLDTEEIVKGNSRVLTTLALNTWKRLQLHLHHAFSKPNYWDLRPPVPAQAIEASPDEARAFIEATKLPYEEEEIGDIFIMLSAILNHEYQGIKENAASFTQAIQEMPEIVGYENNVIDEDMPDYKLDKICSAFASYILAKALPRQVPLPRTGGLAEPLPFKPREDFPQDGLSFQPYYELYDSGEDK